MRAETRESPQSAENEFSVMELERIITIKSAHTDQSGRLGRYRPEIRILIG